MKKHVCVSLVSFFVFLFSCFFLANFVLLLRQGSDDKREICANLNKLLLEMCAGSVIANRYVQPFYNSFKFKNESNKLVLS